MNHHPRLIVSIHSRGRVMRVPTTRTTRDADRRRPEEEEEEEAKKNSNSLRTWTLVALKAATRPTKEEARRADILVISSVQL